MRKYLGPLQIGEKHGRLTVEKYLHTDGHPRRYFLCRCDCGGEVVTHANNLRKGNTKSCGCLHKEVQAAKRIPGGHGEVTAIILGYKRHAERRGHVWSLTREQVISLIKRPCAYCGAPPSNTKVTKNTVEPLVYSGIDRVDNSAGYVLGNVAPCCRVCNRAKETLSVSEFAEWANRLAAMALQWGGEVAEMEAAA